jgi:hypothetical protein
VLPARERLSCAASPLVPVLGLMATSIRKTCASC